MRGQTSLRTKPAAKTSHPRLRALRLLASLVWVAGIATIASSPTDAGASSERLAALGGESRLLTDPENLFLYPGSAHELAHFRIELFDDWGGGLYSHGDHAFGLFLNRPTPQLSRLNAYLEEHGSRNFRRLEARPLADFVYAYRLAEHLRVGVLGRFSYDRHDLTDVLANVSSTDVRVGLRFHQIEATLGALRRRFEDRPLDRAFPLEQTDGDGLLVDVRARLTVAQGLVLLPSVAYESDSFALAPTTRDFSRITAGLAVNAEPAPGVLVVAGVIAASERSQENAPGRAELEEAVAFLPITILAGEVQVGSMLFRLGIRHENILSKREGIRDDGVAVEKHFDTRFRSDLGIGMRFGPLTMDGLLERDFLRDGPHIVGGSRHGGGIFSSVSLTYHFD